MRTLTLMLCAFILAAGPLSSYAFCGFYVAKADAQLFNKSSEVILVRDGDFTVITMANDFQGDIKEFAMVVPVPEVLQEDQIRIADQLIFDHFDAYSGPRIVEYYDPNPCYDYNTITMSDAAPMQKSGAEMPEMVEDEEQDLGVTVEATYTVGEYDILILSAKESDGLKTWLDKNGYKTPKTADEVLDPYIKSNLKFFVVKVNLDKFSKTGFTNLRPIQIAFHSDKFMLPIRLGMANAEDVQDLIVYAFTKNGRVESTNYRTVKIPTDYNVPQFVQSKFGDFYKDMFTRTYERENKKALFLEYAWDLSSSNFVKCDPCASTPPTYTQLREAGVFWVTQGGNGWGGADYSGDVFFTRLHVRYDRENFPQDLQFQVTPNKEQFQGRYVTQIAVGNNLNCEGANQYYKTVVDRRQDELKNLAYLTGWDITKHQDYVEEYASALNYREDGNGWIKNPLYDENGVPLIAFLPSSGGGMGGMMLVLVGGLLTIMLAVAVGRRLSMV